MSRKLTDFEKNALIDEFHYYIASNYEKWPIDKQHRFIEEFTEYINDIEILKINTIDTVIFEGFATDIYDPYDIMPEKSSNTKVIKHTYNITFKKKLISLIIEFTPYDIEEHLRIIG